MNNFNFPLMCIAEKLDRIANALEESNKMVKDLGGSNE